MTDKTLEQVLKNAIEKAEGALDAGVDFAMAQAPEVIQQAMMWHMTISIIQNIAFFFILAAFMLLVKHFLNNYENENYPIYNEELFQILFGVLGVCFAIIFPVIGGTRLLNLTWLKIWIAPKLWLIEYAASLAK